MNRTTALTGAALATALAAGTLLTLDDPDSPCDTAELCAAYAWCDSADIPRAECGLEHSRNGIVALAERTIGYPCDLPVIQGEAEAMTPDGLHVKTERLIVPCEEPAPLNSTVFRSTIRAPEFPVTDIDTPEVVSLDIETVQAGTCDVTCDRTSENGVPVQISFRITRDRLPAGCLCSSWIEGPVSVARRIISGRDPLNAVDWGDE